MLLSNTRDYAKNNFEMEKRAIYNVIKKSNEDCMFRDSHLLLFLFFIYYVIYSWLNTDINNIITKWWCIFYPFLKGPLCQLQINRRFLLIQIHVLLKVPQKFQLQGIPFTLLWEAFLGKTLTEWFNFLRLILRE